MSKAGHYIAKEKPAGLSRLRSAIRHRWRSYSHCALVLLLLVAPTGAGLAQQAQIASPDFFSDLWTKVQQAGPFAALICLWFLWRSEKRSDRLQTERDGLLERVIVGLTNATNVIDKQSLTIERLLVRAELTKKASE